MSRLREKLNIKSNAQLKGGNVEIEVHLSELVQIVKHGSKLSKHSILVILSPILQKTLGDLQNYSSEKDLKLKVSMNLKTFVVIVTCLTAIGIVTYVYGIIPAVGTAVAATLIYQTYKLLKPRENFKTEFVPMLDYNY